MAEKAFKVPSLALVGSGNQLAVNAATNKIEWQGPQFTDTLAYESYVDQAVSNVTVNVEAIAGSGLTYTPTGGDLSVNPGTGLFIQNDAVLVNTNAVAEALASGSLYVSEGDNLNVNANALAGDGSYVDTKIYTGNNIYGSSYLAVNVNALTLRSGENGSLGKSISTGSSSLGREILFVNVNALAGTGLISGDNTGVGAKNGGDYKLLSVNVNNIASSILSTDDDTLSIGTDNLLKVNTNAVAEALGGSGVSGLYWMTGTQNLAVNTNVIATKAYVDGVAQGLDIKESVKYASVASVTLADLYNGNNNSDAGTGSNFVTGDRVLLKNQSNKNENGIWVVSPASTAMPTRATDADSFDKLNKGSFVFVETGNNAGKGYVVTYTNESAALGDAGTENSWSQFSETGNYITSASAPFSVVNGTLSLNTTTALYVDIANQLAVNTNAIAGTGLSGASNILSVNVDPLVAVGSGLYTVQIAGPSQLAVNTNAIVGNLDGAGLYVTGANELAVNTNAIVGNLDGSGLYVTGAYELAINTNALATLDYGAKSFYIKNDSTYSKRKVNNVTADDTSSNTYVTVATFDLDPTTDPEMFSADIMIKVGSKRRTSKISGLINPANNTADYTEFAIVEQGGAIADVDVAISEVGGLYYLLVKGEIAAPDTLNAVAEVTTLGYIA